MLGITNLKIHVGVLSAIIVALISTGALAEVGIREIPQKGKFSMTLEGGTSFPVDGDFVSSESGTLTTGSLLGRPGNKTYAIVLADIDVRGESQDFSDVYDTPLVARLGFNYGLSDASEVFGRFQYTHASSDDFDFATVTAAGTIRVFTTPSLIVDIPLSAGDTIEAELDDYEEFALDVGYRRFFLAKTNKFRPYASVGVGMSYIDGIDIEYSAGSTKIAEGSFYDDSWVFNGSLGVGFRYSFTNVAIGVETGIRYQDDLDDDDGDLPSLFEDANDDSARWDILVMIGVTYQF